MPCIQSKLFALRNEDGVPYAGGGYIFGDGNLPKDFNPDEFMAKFSIAIASREPFGKDTLFSQ